MLRLGLAGALSATLATAQAAPEPAAADGAQPRPCPEASHGPAHDERMHRKIVRCRADLAEPGDRTISPCPHAQPSQLVWNPDWPRFSLGEGVATGLAMAGALGSLAIPEVEDRWSRPGRFDSWMRNRLRLGTPTLRRRARDASDVLLTLEINLLVVDSLAIAWWVHGSGDVAIQMALIDIEAVALNSVVNSLVAAVTSRERPYGDGCADVSRAGIDDCTDRRRYRSFFSGHTSTSFTAAGLTCMHHAYLPLYGGGAGDTIACGTSFLAAGAVGMLRVVADQHYVSDVLVGAGIGTLTGLGVPWLLHYRGGASELSGETTARDRDGVSIGFVPGPTGATLWGMF